MFIRATRTYLLQLSVCVKVTMRFVRVKIFDFFLVVVVVAACVRVFV